MNQYSVALTSEVHEQAASHLIRDDRQEDLCFGLWFPSQGRIRMTALIQQVILPRENERMVHGNASFFPQYFERALSLALSNNAGLALMHSHCGPGWQGMSPDDIAAEQDHAAAVKAATGLPFIGLTLAIDGAWSARFWIKTRPRTYTRYWCESVRVIGSRLVVTFTDFLIPKPRPRREQMRTISAWGETIQADITRLHVGVVGAGSVGAMVAESLARMGVSHISLFDFDSVEVENLDRLLHAKQVDAQLHRPKVAVLAKALRSSATAQPFRIDAYEWSVAEEEGFRAALDCDILFSCVDRHWPRSVLNFIAYAHLIPVIDGGIRLVINKNGHGLKRGDMRAHVASPSHKCLECLGQFDPGHVATERDGYANDPNYIEEVQKANVDPGNQNVFGFSMFTGGMEILQFLSLLVTPSGKAIPGAQLYHFIPGHMDSDHSGCNENCIYTKLIALGDRSSITITASDQAAERARQNRKGRIALGLNHILDLLSVFIRTIRAIRTGD